MSAFDLLSCVICGGTGWGSQYSTPRIRNGVKELVAVYAPCTQHGPDLAPDRIEIPVSERRIPRLGIDYVIEHDVCLAGEPAVNGRCGDLDCICAPSVLASNTRVRHDGEDARFFVCEDHGETFTVMAEVGYKLQLRIPKSGWNLVGTLAFPIEPEVVS